MCLDSIHFHWGSTDEQGSEHFVDGQQYPMELQFLHYNCDREGGMDEVEALYQTEDQLDTAKALALDYHETGIVSVLFEVSDDDNPAFDAILSGMDRMKYPMARSVGEEENAQCQSQSFRLEQPLNLQHLIPNLDDKDSDNDSDSDGGGYFSYEGSLTTPPCTTNVRWYILKKLGCISQYQLNQFRTLLGATENGEIFPLINNFRPIQPIDDRFPVYECGGGDSPTSNGMIGSCGLSENGDKAQVQDDRTYSRNINYNAATAEDTSVMIAGFNHIIAILAAVVGILCFVLTVGAFYFRGVLIRYERKLSDHIELELQSVLPYQESDDSDSNFSAGPGNDVETVPETVDSLET